MSRLHSTVVALVPGAATAAGLFAAVRTVQLGQKVSAPKTVSLAPRDLASRQAKLDRWSKSLRRQRAKRPSALPKLPKYAPVPVPQAASAASPVAQAAPASEAPVRYVRPLAVVKYRRATPPPATTTSSQPSWSDDGSSEGGAGSDDGTSTGGGD
jgi:hypothetical protein